MKTFDRILIICFISINCFGQNNEVFKERPINGLIYGASSVLVEDINNDGKQDILAYPIQKTGFAIYQNNDSLNFELQTTTLNTDINALSFSDFNSDSLLDLLIVSDSSIQIAYQHIDTFIVGSSFSFINSIEKIEKTSSLNHFITLNEDGQLSLLKVDSNEVVMNSIEGQNNISSYEIESSLSDTTHIFTYSDSLKTISYLQTYEDTVWNQYEKDSLSLNSKFCIFKHFNQFELVTSLKNENSVLNFTFSSDTTYYEKLVCADSNVAILNAGFKNDSLRYYYLWRERNIVPWHYADFDGYKINEIVVNGDSIMSDKPFLNYMNGCETMLPVDLDYDSNLESSTEYVLFSDLLDQITIYKNDSTYFNISRSNEKELIQTIMTDVDVDGDLDAVSLMHIPGNPVGGNCDFVYFENIGDYTFRNKVINRDKKIHDILPPLTITMNERPHVFFQYRNISSRPILVLRFWIDNLGKEQLELLDSSANSASLYSYKRMFTGDLEGDGDQDIILQGEGRVYAYQNRDSVIVRLVNTYGGGSNGVTMGQALLLDLDQDGRDNEFLGVSHLTSVPGHFQFERHSFLPPENRQISVHQFHRINELYDMNNYEKCLFLDWNLDGQYDFTMAKNHYGHEASVIFNTGNLSFDTTQITNYYFVKNSDTIIPFSELWFSNTPHVYDFENNFEPKIVNYTRDGYDYYKSINDSVFSSTTIFSFNTLFHHYRYKIKFDDFDKDNDIDFTGLNSNYGSSYFENNTCNTKYDIDTTICETFYSPTGNLEIHQSGVFYDSSVDSIGCIHTWRFNVKALMNDTMLPVSSCSDYISPSGNLWNQTGIYSDTLVNSQGCDSIITIDLEILNTFTELDEIYCDSMVSPSSKDTWYSSGVYYDTVLNSNGCFSFYKINLEIEVSQSELLVSDSSILLQDNGDDIQIIEWLDCTNSNIIDSNVTEFFPDTIGFYSAIIQTSNCLDTLMCVEFIGANMPYNTPSEFIIYPSGSDNLVVEFEGLVENLQINVLNVGGEVILSIQSENVSKQLVDMSNYSTGVYIFSCKLNDKTINMKTVWIAE
ncbi:MAG: FG-GAP repeat domain-containing protein [Flavobacteriales bacterium]